MNRIYHLLLVVIVVIFASCKKSDTNHNNPTSSGEVFVLGVGGYGVEVKTSGPANDATIFGTDKLAVYAVSYRQGEGISWPNTPQEYFIYNINSTVASSDDAAKKVKAGDILYYDPLNGAPQRFPETRMAVYCVYPSEATNGVVLHTPSAGKAPSAKVTLKSECSQQYDIMIGANTDIDRGDLPAGNSTSSDNNNKRAKVVFNHTLAQLRIRIFADDTDPGQKPVGALKLTNVKVHGNTTADIDDISADMDDLYSSHGTPLNMTLFAKSDSSGMTVPYKSVYDNDKSKGLVDGYLMIFPGVKQASAIYLTIDGNTFRVNIPDTYQLQVGKVNYLDVKLTKLGAVIDSYDIAKWADGGANSGNTQIEQYKTKCEMKLTEGFVNTTPYSGTFNTPDVYYASVMINDFWLRNDDTQSEYIPCILQSDGTFTFEDEIPTLMLTNDPVYLTELSIYQKVNNTGVAATDYLKLFGDKVRNNITPEIVVGTGTTGKVTVNSSTPRQLVVNMSMGCFGDGKSDFPYEISTAAQLANMTGFGSASAVSATYFVQTDDINISSYSNWNPIGSTGNQFYGVYDGNDKTISGLTISRSGTAYQGLFGVMGKPTDTHTKVKDLTINGTVTGGSQTGAFAGQVNDDATFTNCISNVKITATGNQVGGLIGFVSGNLTMSGCNNNTSASPAITVAGNSVGGLVGQVTGNPSISLSGNASAMSVTGNDVGGVVGNITGIATIDHCNKTTSVINVLGSSSARVGGIVGSISDGGTISNCTNGVDITSAGTFVGGIIAKYDITVASNVRQALVSNCSNTGSISSTSTATSAMNLSGIVSAGPTNSTAKIIIRNSSNTGNVSGRSGYIAGLMANTTSNVDIESCSNSGNITTSTGTASYMTAGILAGVSTNVAVTVNISESINSGVISTAASTSNTRTAGIFAGNQTTTPAPTINIKECVNTGAVNNTATGALAYVSGIAAYAAPAGSAYNINDCYNTGAITGASAGSFVSGIVGFAAANTQSKTIQYCYNAGEIRQNNTLIPSPFYTANADAICNINATTITILNCYTDSRLTIRSNRSNVTTTDLSTDAAAVLTGLNNGGAKTIWKSDIGINGGMPILSWQ